MPAPTPGPDPSSVLRAGPWRHRDISANGTRLHIAEAGEGPLVLLLHGFPEFWWTWRHQIPALADAGCEIRASDEVRTRFPQAVPATPQDWTTEYLDAIISVKLVDGVAGAIDHIETFSSHHTEAIVAEDARAAERFFNEIDSAILLHNASTQFADGGEFGMGAEIGIATGKMHARGPVGVEQLTSFKYRVRGSGQVRP